MRKRRLPEAAAVFFMGAVYGKPPSCSAAILRFDRRIPWALPHAGGCMDAPVKPEHDVGARLRDRMRSGFVRRGRRKRPQKRKRPSAGSERPKSREETPKKGSSDAKRRYEKEFRLRSGLPQRTILQVRSAYIAYHSPFPGRARDIKGSQGAVSSHGAPRSVRAGGSPVAGAGGSGIRPIAENAWLQPEAVPSSPVRAVGRTLRRVFAAESCSCGNHFGARIGPIRDEGP